MHRKHYSVKHVTPLFLGSPEWQVVDSTGQHICWCLTLTTASTIALCLTKEAYSDELASINAELRDLYIAAEYEAYEND
jgi:hypothetical protein